MPDYIEELNEGQRNAVLYNDGPSLVIAGAGSGKTRVLTYKIAYLLENGYQPWNILALTFANKAAREMKERIARQVGPERARHLWMGTFHSMFLRILHVEAGYIGFTSQFTIYDTADSKSLIRSIIKEMGLDEKVYKPGMVQARISNAKNHLVSPAGYANNKEAYEGDRAAKVPALRDIYQRYWERCRQADAMDFDDLLFYTFLLFRDHPEVLARYQDQFRYILVDEYQDTNTAQFELIRLLALKYQNLCVVGDDDQSIYKFRGANIYNILNFEHHFPDATVIKLEQNYRSTQKILDVANEVIKNNAGRKDKRLWTSVKDGTKVIFNVYENGYEEARGIAEDIAHRHLHDRKDYSDFAILYRTNAQSRSLEEKLIEKNIPYRIYGGINFYARREIKDILAYLKTIDNARDDLAVKRILNVPKRGIGATSVAKVDDYAYENDITFYVALRQAKEVPGLQRAVSKVEGFVTQIEILKSKSQYIGVGKLIEEIIETVGYSDYIDTESESDEQATERRQN